MELFTLQCLCKTLQEGGLAPAAQALGIRQEALEQLMINLETKLKKKGCPYFPAGTGEAASQQHRPALQRSGAAGPLCAGGCRPAGCFRPR